MEFKDLSPKMKMLLTSIPLRNEDVEWIEEDGKIVLVYPKNFTRFERFLHRHIGGPENIRRPLDEKGAFIWRMCDGNHNIHDICKKTYKKFKEDIEPVVKRVWGFLEMLLRLNLIILNAPEKEEQGKEKDIKENESERNGKG